MGKVLIGNFKGPQGPKGDTGPQGPQGPQGIQGPAATATSIKLSGYNRGTNGGDIAATDDILAAFAKMEYRISMLETEIQSLLKIK